MSSQVLAHEIDVSIRTLYRDIASLHAQGAAIEGEPGVGYVMKPGFMLPPLMFGSNELDALVLGMRWVADRGDKNLANGALSTLAKISAVLPPDLRRELQESALLVGAGQRLQTIRSTPICCALQSVTNARFRSSTATPQEQPHSVWFGLSRLCTATNRAC